MFLNLDLPLFYRSPLVLHPILSLSHLRFVVYRVVYSYKDCYINIHTVGPRKISEPIPPNTFNS